ncbi:MAG: PD-(D/E)XK nuclease family protein [Magnetococcales bacterium]|nr:PD-(D/E)XK nuclease family protein [Magnetococcales bacterium]
MTPSSSIHGIEALNICMDRGGTLITVNQRLSRYLTRRLNSFKASQDKKTWLTVPVFPLQAWLHRQWLELLGKDRFRGEEWPMLLPQQAERQLWERVIIEHTRKGKTILWPGRCAVLAQEAWETLHEWCLQPPVAESQGHEDSEALIDWLMAFKEELRRGPFLTAAQLPEWLGRQVDALNLPAEIVLAGFDRLPPAQERLFSLLEEQGVAISRYGPETFAAQVTLRIVPGREEEIRQAARWAKAMIDGENSARMDDGTIGIIHPSLGQWRKQVIRIFTEVFYPGAMEWNVLPREPLFNLSLGFPLMESPLIAEALFFLQSCRDGCCSAAGFSRFLHSPYCGGGRSENAARAILDVRWREQGWRLATFRELQAWVIQEGQTPALAAILSGLALLDRTIPDCYESAPPSVWAVRCSAMLSLVGWPGEKPISSADFKLLNAWQDLLGGLTALDRVEEVVDFDRALAVMRQAACATVYQPEGGGEAPVQILGSLEAGGETFAALWILGMSDDAWPPRPEPNPLLPRSFQRRHGLPRSSAEREYEYVARMTQNLLMAAPVVVVSAPRQDGDTILRPSPLVRDLETVLSDAERQHDFSYAVFIGRHLEVVADDIPPPLTQGGRHSYPAGVLRGQSLCPFQAYAHYRLAARPLPKVGMGMTPTQRGQLTHGALANLLAPGFSIGAWRKKTVEEREILIAAACRRALQGLAKEWERQVPTGLLEWECQRQTNLLGQWMELECRRGSDFSVAAVEQPGSIVLSGLELNYRLDRVDRLETGDTIVIDYKTGRVNRGVWFGERPRDTQMPLYALAMDQPLVALVYAQMSRHGKHFVGLAESPGVLPGVGWIKEGPDALPPPDFDFLKNHWRGILESLAQEFIQGRAEVDPQPNACDQCQLHPLCRVDEPM